MISGQAFLGGDGLFLWGGSFAAGDTFALQSTGLAVNGVDLLEIVPSTGGAGHWEPVTNGDTDNPELVFYNGDVVMYWVTP